MSLEMPQGNTENNTNSYESLGLSRFVLELRGYVRARFRAEGIPEEEINELTKTQEENKENPSTIISQVKDEDIENLIESYEAQKKDMLAEFNEKGEGFNPETGNIVTNDTSWWDAKIDDLRAIQEKIIVDKFDKKESVTFNDLESKKADIEKRRELELNGPGILYHGTASKEDVLSGLYDENKAFATAGQAVGPGLYLTSKKNHAENYSEDALQAQKNKNRPLGEPAVLFFNKKDFNIVENEIGEHIAEKVHSLYPEIEGVTRDTTGKELFRKLVKDLTGEEFQSSLVIPEIVDIMVGLGIDGLKVLENESKGEHYVLYNFPKIKTNEINAKYDAELAALTN